jgi:hypothetical protein
MPIIPAWGEVRPTITTKVVSSNSAHGEVYTIQHYVIKSVTSRRPVVFSSTIYIYIWNIVESGVKHHNPNPYYNSHRIHYSLVELLNTHTSGNILFTFIFYGVGSRPAL